MGKIGKLFCLALCFCILFSGCHRISNNENVVPDLVRSVSVYYQRKDTTFHRTYTNTQKIDVILYYIYTLSPHGKASQDPESYLGDRCRITVTLTSGKTHIYRQFGAEYFSADHKPWQKIDKSKASVLFHLLAHMESDA